MSFATGCGAADQRLHERFNHTALAEFFRIAFRTTLYESVEALQTDVDRWLVESNTEHPHPGHRNQGQSTIETILSFLEKCAPRRLRIHIIRDKCRKAA